MKQIDLEKDDELQGKRIKEGERFSFRCHQGLSCFNRCCRNLNLLLYPYDVLRLTKQLGISSDEFLDEYVDVVLRPGNYFPEVLLKMSETEEKTCPFLTPEGCSVYPDRPDTCRTFPMEQGILYDKDGKEIEFVYFFRPPDFCRGQDEETRWTPRTWIEDQDAETYQEMTARWAGIKRLFQSDPWPGQGPDCPAGKMAFMAAYNMDKFREFVFNSTFLKRYKIKSDVLKKIKSSDTQLLKLGLEWIELYVWGVRSKHIRLKQKLR